MKYTFLIIILIIFNNIVYSQRQVDLEPHIFLNNIKQKVFKVKRSQGGEDVYVDLNTKSYISPGNPYVEEEQFVKFEYHIFEGSFINKNTLEYLFIIKLSEESIVSFFGHAENYGNTTMFYIFDSLYNQISDVAFQDSYTELIDITDIDNDGINEIFMISTYSQMGNTYTWLMVFNKYFEEPILEVTIKVDYYSPKIGEFTTLNADYLIEKGMIIFNSKLDYYLGLGSNEDGSFDNRFIKTEYKRDAYEFKNGKFQHIKDKNNFNWDDVIIGR